MRAIASYNQRVPSYSYVDDRHLVFEIDLDAIPPSRLGDLLFRYEDQPSSSIAVASGPSFEVDQPSTSSSYLAQAANMMEAPHLIASGSTGPSFSAVTENTTLVSMNRTLAPLPLEFSASGSPPNPGSAAVTRVNADLLLLGSSGLRDASSYPPFPGVVPYSMDGDIADWDLSLPDP